MRVACRWHAASMHVPYPVYTCVHNETYTCVLMHVLTYLLYGSDISRIVVGCVLRTHKRARIGWIT